MHTDKYNEMFNAAPLVPHSIVAADTAPWIVIQYNPDMGTGGTAATVEKTSTDSLKFLVDAAAPAGLDAIGTAGVIDLLASGYDTMGELVDYIDGRRAWSAYLVGAIRTDVSSLLLDTVAASCIGDNGVKIYGDSSVSKEFSFAISGEKFVTNSGKGGRRRDWNDQCVNALMYGAFTVGAAITSAAIGVKIYQGRAGQAEELLQTIALTEDTLKEIGEQNPSITYLTSRPGYRLIVRAYTDSLWDAAPDIQCLGKTAVLSGAFIVVEKNY